MEYKKTYIPQYGYTSLCNRQNSSLSMLRFGIIRLKNEQVRRYDTGSDETAFILLGGMADFAFDDTVWQNVGGRRDVFDGRAHSVYLPRGKQLSLTGRSDVTIAVIGTAADIETTPQWITPDDVTTTVLGEEHCRRDVHFIIDSRSNAKRLTIGEAFVSPGNWAGFPPHKHDEDNMPLECLLEEIYFFQFRPEQGFGLQYMYTKDGGIDVCYPVNHNDLVEFPRGYHTTVTAPGYNAYFLWMMAGEHQGFYRTNDPAHSNC